MKKKLSLLLVMVMALTMVLGTGVCAWAAGSGTVDTVCDDGTSTNHFYFTGQTYGIGGTEYCCGYVYMYNGDSTPAYFNWTEKDSSSIAIGSVELGKLYDIDGSTHITSSGWYYGVYGDGVALTNWVRCTGEHIDPPGQAVAAVAPCAKPVLEQPVYVAAPHVHEWVEGVIYDATADADGLEGVYCKTCGAIRESSLISAYSYTLEKYALEKINASKPGQTITFEFGELNSFPKSFMEKLVAKSAQGVTFVFKYKVNHELQTITIPAGTSINLDFDWYGYAKMAELYGMY